MEQNYICPECGHVFKQGEYNYNYETGLLDFECPECDWCGTEKQIPEPEENYADELHKICRLDRQKK